MRLPSFTEFLGEPDSIYRVGKVHLVLRGFTSFSERL